MKSVTYFSWRYKAFSINEGGRFFNIHVRFKWKDYGLYVYFCGHRYHTFGDNNETKIS